LDKGRTPSLTKISLTKRKHCKSRANAVSVSIYG